MNNPSDHRSASGLARNPEDDWFVARFELLSGSLFIAEVGTQTQLVEVPLGAIAGVVALSDAIDGCLTIEIATSTGEVCQAQLPVEFVDEFVAVLRSAISPPESSALALEPPGSPEVEVAESPSINAAESPAVDSTDDPVLHSAKPWVRTAQLLSAAVLILFGLMTVYVGSVYTQVERTKIALPTVDDGVSTWLLIGSDSRKAAKGLPSPGAFGSVKEVPGERADVVLLVQEGLRGQPPRVVSVPRDLLVFREGVGVDRLTLTLLDGPQGVVTSVCRSIGIAVDHVALIRFDGMRSILDSVGGIDVRADFATRDFNTGLRLRKGDNHLDGAQAIAWLRSRQIEEFVNGKWRPNVAGDDGRQLRQRQLLTAVSKKMGRQAWNPLRLHRLAWSTAGAITTDRGTGPIDLARLGATLGQVNATESLPHNLQGGEIPSAQLRPEAAFTLNAMRDRRPDGPPCPEARIVP